LKATIMNYNTSANTASNWNDFNDAQAQQGAFDPIPKGTIVALRMSIKPGGHDDHSQGWTGGYATESFESGAVYLACEFVVTSGPYAKRKLWSNIGLLSKKGPTWGQMGRSFIRAALNSARNVHPQDNTEQASAARRISGFADLEGLEFIARLDVEKDIKGEDRNVVKMAIEPDHKDYAALRRGGHVDGGFSGSLTAGAVSNVTSNATSGANSGAAFSSAPTFSAPALAPQSAVTGKPAWAQ
jgi:hypothetical protein